MPYLPTRAEFWAKGVKPCAFPDDSPECPICQEAFQSEAFVSNKPVPSEPVPQKSRATRKIANQSIPPAAENRTPRKMPCCKNLFCRDCTNVWFDTANTCPTCRAKLFAQDHHLNTDYIEMFVDDTPYGPMWVLIASDDEDESDCESEDEVSSLEEGVDFDSEFSSYAELTSEPEDLNDSDFSACSDDSDSDDD